MVIGQNAMSRTKVDEILFCGRSGCDDRSRSIASRVAWVHTTSWKPAMRQQVIYDSVSIKTYP